MFSDLIKTLNLKTALFEGDSKKLENSADHIPRHSDSEALQNLVSQLRRRPIGLVHHQKPDIFNRLQRKLRFTTAFGVRSERFGGPKPPKPSLYRSTAYTKQFSYLAVDTFLIQMPPNSVSS
ncbi:MAG: hypothetical protein ACI9MC_002113 [Kiritimatiellia bacterium]|jgi:hypothetical protein